MLLAMDVIALAAIVAVAFLAVAGISLAVAASARRSFADAVGELGERHRVERDAAVAAALRQVDVLNRSHLDGAAMRLQAGLDTSKDVIGANLEAVRAEMRGELGRLGDLVTALGTASAQRFGQVDASLRNHAEVAAALSNTTKSLQEALANPR